MKLKVKLLYTKDHKNHEPSSFLNLALWLCPVLFKILLTNPNASTRL